MLLLLLFIISAMLLSNCCCSLPGSRLCCCLLHLLVLQHLQRLLPEEAHHTQELIKVQPRISSAVRCSSSARNALMQQAHELHHKLCCWVQPCKHHELLQLVWQHKGCAVVTTCTLATAAANRALSGRHAWSCL
jgi:hypothetical protein